MRRSFSGRIISYEVTTIIKVISDAYHTHNMSVSIATIRTLSNLLFSIINSTYTPDAGNMRSYRAPEVVSNSADELFQPELYDSMSSRHYGAPAASSMMRQGLYVDRSALTTSSWLDRSGTALVQGGTAAKKQI